MVCRYSVDIPRYLHRYPHLEAAGHGLARHLRVDHAAPRRHPLEVPGPQHALVTWDTSEAKYLQPKKAKEVDTSSKISMYGLAASKTAMENGLGLTVNYWKFNTQLKSLFISLFLKIY